MTMRAPPRLASWLLKVFSGKYHADSLLGDSIEEFARGRSAWWYWRQVMGVIVVRCSRFPESRLWIAGVRLIGHLLIELAAVLALVELSQEWQRHHSLKAWTSAEGVLGLAVLLAMAMLGCVAWLWAYRWKKRSLLKSLIVLLAVTMGAGTAVWAGTTQAQVCASKTCPCQVTPAIP